MPDIEQVGKIPIIRKIEEGDIFGAYNPNVTPKNVALEVVAIIGKNNADRRTLVVMLDGIFTDGEPQGFITTDASVYKTGEINGYTLTTQLPSREVRSGKWTPIEVATQVGLDPHYGDFIRLEPGDLEQRRSYLLRNRKPDDSLYVAQAIVARVSRGGVVALRLFPELDWEEQRRKQNPRLTIRITPKMLAETPYGTGFTFWKRSRLQPEGS